MTKGSGFEDEDVVKLGLPTRPPTDPTLPIVSVIVVNHNYGRFVGEALASIAAQTYPNIETVLVDDVSSDDSMEIISRLTAPDGPHPDVAVHVMSSNGGQTLASQLGFNRSCGAYVVFLDADDVLLPACIETHVYAHMSSRIAVGFSTVDVFNRVDGRDVTSGTEGFAAYAASGAGQLKGMFRPIDEAHPDGWFARRRKPVRAEEVHVARAPFADPWIWSPTSANCFRREAVARMLHGDALAAMRWGTDSYLMRGIAAVNGSMLIDRPLMAYRVHGRNVFTMGAPLDRQRIYDAPKNQAEVVATVKAAVRRIIADMPVNGMYYSYPDVAWQAIHSLCKAWPGLPAENGGKDFLTEQLIENEAMLTRVFGVAVVANWLMWSGAAPARGASRAARWWLRRLLTGRRDEQALVSDLKEEAASA